VASRQDWAALGLRGTGSHTLTADDLHVEDANLLTVDVLFRDDPSGPFGLRVPSRMRTALGLASVAVGSAVALHTACAGSISRPVFATTLGDVVSRTRGAKTLLVDTADRLDEAAAASRPLPAPLLAEARMLLSRVVRDIADAAHEVSLIAGARACLTGDDVGRLWRDTHVATRHGALSPAAGFELGGRAVLDPASSSATEVAGPLAPSTAAVPAAR
jgi:alkylation response protein AidB-like acyl-CoA dehydrogenase